MTMNIRDHIINNFKGDNYEEALKEKEKNDYDIEIKAIGTFDEAVSYLESLEP